MFGGVEAIGGFWRCINKENSLNAVRGGLQATDFRGPGQVITAGYLFLRHFCVKG
jgi:hypothetical protein